MLQKLSKYGKLTILLEYLDFVFSFDITIPFVKGKISRNGQLSNIKFSMFCKMYAFLTINICLLLGMVLEN